MVPATEYVSVRAACSVRFPTTFAVISTTKGASDTCTTHHIAHIMAVAVQAELYMAPDEAVLGVIIR